LAKTNDTSGWFTKPCWFRQPPKRSAREEIATIASRRCSATQTGRIANRTHRACSLIMPNTCFGRCSAYPPLDTVHSDPGDKLSPPPECSPRFSSTCLRWACPPPPELRPRRPLAWWDAPCRGGYRGPSTGTGKVGGSWKNVWHRSLEPCGQGKTWRGNTAVIALAWTGCEKRLGVMVMVLWCPLLSWPRPIFPKRPSQLPPWLCRRSWSYPPRIQSSWEIVHARPEPAPIQPVAECAVLGSWGASFSLSMSSIYKRGGARNIQIPAGIGINREGISWGLKSQASSRFGLRWAMKHPVHDATAFGKTENRRFVQSATRTIR